MTTPYVGFGNETLRQQPNIRDGELILCPLCSGKHPVEFAGTDEQKAERLLGMYRCGSDQYLAAVGGKLVAGLKADVSGEI